MKLIEGLLYTPVVEMLGRILLHSLWQGTAIAVGLAVVLWLFRGLSSAARYNLAVLALIVCALLPVMSYGKLSRYTTSVATPVQTTIVPPLATAPEMLESTAVLTTLTEGHSSSKAVATNTASVHGLSTWKKSIEPLLPWAVVVWLLGVITLSLRLLIGLRLLRKLRSSFTSPAPEFLTDAAKRIATCLYLKGNVELRLSRVVSVPMVVGYLKPVILIPVSILSGLTPRQLEMIVAHELAHLKRFDHLVNLLQNITEVLFFFNPAVWWISFQIRLERECCYDLLAVEVCGGDKLAYAQTLATLNTTRSIKNLALAADGGSLLKRIFRLTGQSFTTTQTPNPAQWLSGVALIALSIFIASVAMAQTQGGVLRIGFADITQLDPYKSAGGEIAVFSLVFDSLFIPSGKDFSPIPHLAESWETPDDTTWIFKLREGVMFQDGNAVFAKGANREVTAEDVVYSINRFI